MVSVRWVGLSVYFRHSGYRLGLPGCIGGWPGAHDARMLFLYQSLDAHFVCGRRVFLSIHLLVLCFIIYINILTNVIYELKIRGSQEKTRRGLLVYWGWGFYRRKLVWISFYLMTMDRLSSLLLR